MHSVKFWVCFMEAKPNFILVGPRCTCACVSILSFYDFSLTYVFHQMQVSSSFWGPISQEPRWNLFEVTQWYAAVALWSIQLRSVDILVKHEKEKQDCNSCFVHVTNCRVSLLDIAVCRLNAPLCRFTYWLYFGIYQITNIRRTFWKCSLEVSALHHLKNVPGTSQKVL